MILKTIPLLLLFAATFIYAKSQPADCFKYKEGKFRVADTRAGVVTIADRHGGYQTESSENIKATVRFKINWQNDCSYTLTLDKVLRNENKIDFPLNLQIHIRIITTNGKSFTQEITSPLFPAPYIVEVTKMD